MQPLIVCLVLTGIHGFFVMAEYSIVKTSNGDKACAPGRISRELSEIHGKLEEYLLVSQIGKTGALMGLGFLLAGADLSLLMPGQFLLIIIAIGLIQLVLGQEVPKYWGVMYSDRCAEAVSSFMKFSYIVFWPILSVVKYVRNSLFLTRK